MNMEIWKEFSLRLVFYGLLKCEIENKCEVAGGGLGQRKRNDAVIAQSANNNMYIIPPC